MAGHSPPVKAPDHVSPVSAVALPQHPVWTRQGEKSIYCYVGGLDENQGGVLDRKDQNNARVQHSLHGGIREVSSGSVRVWSYFAMNSNSKSVCKATKQANENKPPVCRGVSLDC